MFVLTHEPLNNPFPRRFHFSHASRAQFVSTYYGFKQQEHVEVLEKQNQGKVVWKRIKCVLQVFTRIHRTLHSLNIDLTCVIYHYAKTFVHFSRLPPSEWLIYQETPTIIRTFEVGPNFW